MRLVFIDIETNNELREENKIIQLWYITRIDWEEQKEFNKYFWLNEWEKISLPTMNITWITNKQIKWLETFEKDLETIHLLNELVKKNVFVAHNWKDFDFLILKRFWIDIKYSIDTLNIAKYIFRWKEEELKKIENQFKLWILRYYFEEKYWDEFIYEWKSHEALYDCKVLEYVFLKLIKEYKELTWKEDLKEIITDFINISKMTLYHDNFVLWKHRWKSIIYVIKNDKWYIEWIIDKLNSEDFLFEQVYFYLKNWIQHFKDKDIIEIDKKHWFLEKMKRKMK